MNDLLVQQSEEVRRSERLQVIDAVPVLDTGRFEHMQRIATIMAECPWIPDHFRGYYEGDGNNKTFVNFSPRQVMANCFLVVNQAVRWGMDPFAVAQCVSIVRGKICYEGKLIAAVLDAKLGVNLIPEWDNNSGDNFGVKIYAYDHSSCPLVNPRTNESLVAEGTVGEWKTTGTGSPWGAPKNHRRQLMYRGSREWARLYRPAILLGVYADDELEGLERDAAATRARERRAPSPPSKEASAEQIAKIEHKPAPAIERLSEKQELIAEERPRRAPAPPAAAAPVSLEGSIADAFDPEKTLVDFRQAVMNAETGDELTAAWEKHIGPIEDRMFPPDKDNALSIFRLREHELE